MCKQLTFLDGNISDSCCLLISPVKSMIPYFYSYVINFKKAAWVEML